MTTSRQLLEAVRNALPSRQASQPTPVLPAPEKMRSRRKKLPTQEAQEKPAQPPPPQVCAGTPNEPPWHEWIATRVGQQPPPRVLQLTPWTVWLACCSIDGSIRQRWDLSPEQQRSLPVVQVQEVTLEWLRVLRAQAGSLKVRFSELDQLCQAISAVEAFQVRLGSRIQPPLCTLAPSCRSLQGFPAACIQCSVLAAGKDQGGAASEARPASAQGPGGGVRQPGCQHTRDADCQLVSLACCLADWLWQHRGPLGTLRSFGTTWLGATGPAWIYCIAKQSALR